MRPIIPAVAAALFATGAGACTSTSERVVSAAPAVQVTVDRDRPLTRSHEASNLLVDRDDPSRVYLSNVEMLSGECRFHVSVDGGRTWTRGESPALEPYTRNCVFGAAQPQNVRTELSQATDGTLFYAFQANDPAAGGGRSVLLGRSADRGVSWRTSVVHGAPIAVLGQEAEVNFEAHMAIDPANSRRVYAMWRRNYWNTPPGTTRPTRAWMAVSDDGGATFAPPFMPFESEIGFDGPYPIVVGGELFAFWRERAAAVATGQPPNPTRVLVGVSGDQGRTWRQTEIARALDTSEPIPVYDRDAGRFYVVWHDNRSGDLDVYLSTSTDGATWSEARRLNDDGERNRVGQHYPQVRLARGGRLDVAWYDWRDDPYPAPTTTNAATPLALGSNIGKAQSVYYTSSADGGATWLPNLRINDVLIDRTIGTWNNDYFVVVPVGLAALADGAVVSWSDTRNGNADTETQDIYASRISFDATDDDEGIDGRLIGAGLVGAVLGAGLALCGTVLALRSRSRAAG
ncbi:MAG: sialidase family protein [Acidimicrobiales bacterium]